MSNTVQSTHYKMKLLTGEEVSLTLNFAALYALRARNPKVYHEYQKIQKKKKEELEDIDLAFYIYTAYCCTHAEENITFEEFLNVIPFDRTVINEAITNLLFPSKKKNLQKPSKKQQSK